MKLMFQLSPFDKSTWIYGRWSTQFGQNVKERESYWMRGTLDGSKADLLEIVNKERKHDANWHVPRPYPTQRLK